MSSITSIDDEAVNLLSLDGGGVRGVSALVILHGIMTKIKDMYGLPEVPKPCDFFHMIAGTSTGGLIAIMLGRLRMSTTEALEEYDNCAAQIFSKDNRKSWSVSERFRATALQEAVEGLVRKRGLGETMRDPENPQKGKVFVCVMPSDNIGKTHIVRSFYGDEGTQDNWDEDVQIWEAARATTAASTFFKPQILGKGPSARPYIDAAIGVNNPVEYLLPEAVKEFGSGRRFGCVVSIGTGTRGDVRLERSVGGLQSIVKFRGVVYYGDLVKTLKNLATDAEASHRQLESRLLSFPGAYYRFNVPEAAAQVKLHHYLKIPELKSSTAEYLSTPPIAKQVCQIAKVLKTDDFDHGLTLGHIHDLDKDQVLLSNKKTRSMGMTSSFFTGRQDILEKLDVFFAPRDTGGSPRREFLLYGMGGVGKSEIAFKVSEVLEKRFEYIFYVDGSTPATVLQSYANIARRHGLAGALTEELCAKAMRWMERLAEEWLMIFDDCNLSDRQGHLPGRGKGNIIYTSRQTSLNQDLPVECTYEVTPFGEEDAIELLSKASGSPETSENTQDRKTAEAIVRELECLPLAVEKAAAFIRDGGYSLQEYLKKLRDEKVRILSESRSEDEDETNIESPAVHAALELSYQAIASRRRLEGRSGAGLAANLALKVLSLLTFFHHKDFPSLIMKRAAEEHHSVGAPRYCPLSHLMSPYDYDLDRMVRVKGDGHWNPSDFTSGVTILRKFSLVKLSSDRKSLSMHVLVHRWARKRMDKDVVLRWALVARVLLVESLDLSARLGYLQASRDMRPHFEVCFAVEPPLDLIRDQYRAHLLHKLGRYYRDQKRFLDAEECYTQSLRLWRMDLDADCGAVIDVSRSLAQLYHEMGRLGDAELMYLEAIETLRGRLEDMEASTALEKRGGRESPPPAVSSKPYAKSVMRTLVGRLSEHSSGGILSSGLPRLRKRSSKSKEPERPCEPDMPNMLDDGMLVWTRGSGEHFNEVEVIDAASNVLHAELGTVYMDQDRYGVGKRMLLQAVGYLEKQLDKYDPDLMKLQIKARTLTDAGNREVWEHYLADVLQAPQELTLRFWHSEACFDLMIAATYSLLMRDPEDWGAACRELFRLYDAGIKWYGGYDRKMLKVFRYLVECLIVGGDYDSAAFMADICLRRARSTYGELHMESIRSYVTLASAILHQRIELDEKARRVWQEAIDKARAGLGSTHSLTRSLEGHLRKLAEKVERAEQPFPEDLDPEAALMESWRRSEALLEKDRASLGGQHPLIKQSEIFVGDGPVRTKEELLERARAAYGPHNPLTKRLEMELGETQRSASARGPEEDLEPGSSTASRSSVPESHNAERNGKGLRQPLDLINKMTKARHTALRSQEPKSKTRELMAADNFALDDRVLAMISELEGDDLGDPADAETGGDMDAIKLGCQGLFK